MAVATHSARGWPALPLPLPLPPIGVVHLTQALPQPAPRQMEKMVLRLAEENPIHLKAYRFEACEKNTDKGLQLAVEYGAYFPMGESK